MNKLQTILANVNGTSFISIDTVVDVKLSGGKKNEQQGRVQKVSNGSSVMIFQNKNASAYGAMVNRRLIAEGKDPESFSLGERVWGERIPNTPFIKHADELYLEVIFLREPKETYYTLDGVRTDAKDIVGLPVSKPSAESQGGLDNKVIVRTYKCNSIKTIRVDGMEISRTGKSW